MRSRRPSLRSGLLGDLRGGLLERVYLPQRLVLVSASLEREQLSKVLDMADIVIRKRKDGKVFGALDQELRPIYFLEGQVYGMVKLLAWASMESLVSHNI